MLCAFSWCLLLTAGASCFHWCLLASVCAGEAVASGFSAASQAMQSTRSTLMDNYDYVMFGRIFKYKDAPSQGQVRWSPSSRRSQACVLQLGLNAFAVLTPGGAVISVCKPGSKGVACVPCRSAWTCTFPLAAC